VTDLTLIHSVQPATSTKREELERELEREMARMKQALEQGTQALKAELDVARYVRENPVQCALAALAGGILLSQALSGARRPG
jgi:ElaB/YqjD/DUF883 family membrane-anchored ribosome-binding protein